MHEKGFDIHKDPYLVCLEEHLDAPGEGGDGRLLALHEVVQVEADVGEGDAALLHVAGLGHVVVVGVVEQGLGGDAAHVQAGAAQGGVLLNAHGLEIRFG